ncbi:hypothetical protein FOZ63_027335 [Perkinsus olseni]|uniref:Uncharacterized protein n=1 Tax=Perkinsus olseni TaxID=32597 RepID=A0A7J6T4Y9_PEROL|nr:hypothetical protein FOZ63_027335 [Perkinsus olseni]
MLFVLCLCLVHTAISSTTAQSYLRNPTDGQPPKGEGRSYNASELEYRPGRSGDVMFGKPIRRIWKYQRFVAVDPKAPHGRDVVGYVESTADYPLPLCIKSALSDEEMRSILIYILRVKVREDWQNKKVGSTMLPGALEDTFVAADPKAPLGRNVVGYVESTADYPLPLCIKTTLSDKEKRGMVIYILRVKVREDWQNKKVGTMMLPRALKDYRLLIDTLDVAFRSRGTPHGRAY